jgi:hypothetical protein
MSSNHGHGDSTPSARPSISDQGPLALFDLYLRILSDSYIAFLQERFVHDPALTLIRSLLTSFICLQEEG